MEQERASATQAVDRLRAHLAAIVSAALARADAAKLVARALDNPPALLNTATSIHLLAVGKAAREMATAFASRTSRKIAAGLVVSAEPVTGLPMPVQFQRGAHPVPDLDSLRAGQRALALAGDHRADCLVVLLSGGASSMVAVPAAGLTLEDKQATTRALLAQDASIHEVNCVRKHLSAIKGGRLAAACAVPVVTMALSDVVGDDLTVIGSAPTIPDPTTYADALAIVERCGEAVPRDVVRHLQRGVRGEVDETPKPGHLHHERSQATIIGSSSDALEGARVQAVSLGYRVVTLETPVTGEARRAAVEYVAELARRAAATAESLCILSAGETTVHVIGKGMGGRNQEFALAAAQTLPLLKRPAALASFGTDGVDGPTDAAGAIADSTTPARARAHGLDAMQYLGDNDAWRYFDTLGDLLRTGDTGTNVGDVQVTLIAGAATPGRVEAS